jgi:hypothetical protein
MSTPWDDDTRLVHTPWESLDRERLPAVVSLRLLPREPGRPLTLRECIPPFLRWLLAVRGRSALTARYSGESLRAFTLFCEQAGIAEPKAVTEAEVETFVASFTARGCKPATAVRRLSMTALGSVHRSKGVRPNSRRPRQWAWAPTGAYSLRRPCFGRAGRGGEHGKSSTGPRRKVGPGRSGRHASRCTLPSPPGRAPANPGRPPEKGITP